MGQFARAVLGAAQRVELRLPGLARVRRDAILEVLRWLGSAEGASYVGAEGAGLPAVTAAQQEYYDYWEGQGVDTGFFGADGGTATIPGNAASR